MLINLNKCHSISFSMKHNPILVNYKLDNHSINRTSNIKHLGVIFDSKLLFNLHIFKIKKKSLAVFGMIKRNCLQFNDPSTFKSLYSSLIRPHLEYASIIWETWTLSHCKQIEEV
jgi:hypothetical protein